MWTRPWGCWCCCPGPWATPCRLSIRSQGPPLPGGQANSYQLRPCIELILFEILFALLCQNLGDNAKEIRKNSSLSYPYPLQHIWPIILVDNGWRYNLGSNKSIFISFVKEEPFTFECRMWCPVLLWIDTFAMFLLAIFGGLFFSISFDPKGHQYNHDLMNVMATFATIALCLKQS